MITNVVTVLLVFITVSLVLIFPTKSFAKERGDKVIFQLKAPKKKKSAVEKVIASVGKKYYLPEKVTSKDVTISVNVLCRKSSYLCLQLHF